MSLEKFESSVNVWNCRDESDEKMTEGVKYYGEWLLGQPRGRAIMAYRHRRKTWPNKKVEDGDRARMANSARKMNMKMRTSSLTSLFRRNGWAIIADRGPTKATIGRECANDKRESAKEVFKFIVSPNHGVWVILPVKKSLELKIFGSI